MQKGDIYIRDNGSNAGTFINGNRLSPASQPSEPIKVSKTPKVCCA